MAATRRNGQIRAVLHPPADSPFSRAPLGSLRYNRDVNDRSVSRSHQRRTLAVALGLNAAFLVAEVTGGLAFNSVALLADAAHMFSDVVGLSIALVAQRLVDRPSSAQHSYGLQRAEVLGALANGLLMAGVAAWILVEGVRRLADPPEVAGAGLLAVAALGLAVNLVSAVLLARARGRSLNMHGAFLHMLSDAGGSLAAILAGAAILLAGAAWVDPAASLLIAVLVLAAAWRLLRDTVHVLLEGTPQSLRPAEVEGALRAQPTVESVHHMHLWTLASDAPALSAHVVLRGPRTLHEAQEAGGHLKVLLDERFGISHATLELECHDCEPDPA